MPPKKKLKVWKENFHTLMDDHGISFEGPKQPKDWPAEHEHLFKVIRDIWSLRYATFKRSDKMTKQAVNERQRAVIYMSDKAHQLRYGKINEPTWRSLEATILKIFEGKAICETCKHELHMVEYQAEPVGHREFARLQRKRERRRPCRCGFDTGSVSAVHEDNEEAQPMIFTAALSAEVIHDPSDQLRDTDIPRAPDHTIGLRFSLDLMRILRADSSELNHYPVKGNIDLAYPFLVVEAKREVDAPGFRAIEAQTGFPIKRLLLLQENLYQKTGQSFHPLVWFFAYQGDEWRLYAGTLKNSRVRVYDLWHGGIESLDSSLQLLHIIDYIWTWARDIYRPQIRDCLIALAPTIREISPSTEHSLSRSHSFISDARLRPLTARQPDTIMVDDQEQNDQAMQSAGQTPRHHLLQYRPGELHDRQNSLREVTIRHADLVEFSFRRFNCPSRRQMLDLPRLTSEYEILMGHFDTILSSQSCMILTEGQLRSIESLWMGSVSGTASTISPNGLLRDQKVVCFYFHTFVNKKNWQVIRKLDCVLYDAEDIQVHRASESWTAFLACCSRTRELDHYSKLVESLFMVRNISGVASVLYALQDMKLVLSSTSEQQNLPGRLRWAERNTSLMDQFETWLSAMPWPSDLYHENSKTIPLEEQTTNVACVQELMPISEDLRRVGGVLAMKPGSWIQQCPKLCLFVLQDIAIHDRSRLETLLWDVVKERGVYRPAIDDSDQEQLSISSEDHRLIQRWSLLLRG